MPGRPSWAFGYVDVLICLVMLPGVINSLFLLVIVATMIWHSVVKS